MNENLYARIIFSALTTGIIAGGVGIWFLISGRPVANHLYILYIIFGLAAIAFGIERIWAFWRARL